MLQATKAVYLFDCDYQMTPRILLDGVGYADAQQIERLIVESSRGKESENVQHTLDDSYKIIECAINILNAEAAKYP